MSATAFWRARPDRFVVRVERAAVVGLALGDHPTPDRPGSREQRLQLVALAPADRPLQRRQILGEPAEHLEHRLTVVDEHVAPHHRVRAGDPGEIGEPAGGVAQHLGLEMGLEVGDRANDRVGDQVGQVRGDRQHPVVVLGRHRLDPHPDRPPHRGHPLDRRRIGVGERRQDAVPAAEQWLVGGIRAGMLGPGDRVAGDEPVGLREVRADVPDHLRLVGADIGHDRTARQPRRNRLGDRAGRGGRRADHHQVCAPDRLAEIGRRPVGEAQLAGPVQCRPAAGTGDELARQRMVAEIQGERAIDQADPDQGDPLETGDAHRTKPASVSTTWRFSASVPTERRRQCGSP